MTVRDRLDTTVVDYANLSLAITATGSAAATVILAVDKYRHGDDDETKADRLERKAAQIRRKARQHDDGRQAPMQWTVAGP